MHEDNYLDLVDTAAKDYIEAARCSNPGALLSVDPDLVTDAVDGVEFSLLAMTQWGSN
jgi:hypothetical protein